jgi:hypothetical protein
VREYHAYAPHYVDPQCPKRYLIEARINGSWNSVHEEDGNVQRQCIHDFAPVQTDTIRITVLETNGDPSAQIYEVIPFRFNSGMIKNPSHPQADDLASQGYAVACLPSAALFA